MIDNNCLIKPHTNSRMVLGIIIFQLLRVVGTQIIYIEIWRCEMKQFKILSDKCLESITGSGGNLGPGFGVIIP